MHQREEGIGGDGRVGRGEGREGEGALEMPFLIKVIIEYYLLSPTLGETIITLC